MNPQIPRIAIPEPTSTNHAYNQRSLPNYIRAIEASGGEAVTIRLQQAAGAQAEALATCSGILLPGSPADVNPHRYGQEPITACAVPDAARESADDLLLADAFATGKPLLGICFGLQSLNVWRHGTLIQDLPKAAADSSAVDHEPGSEVLDAHTVVVHAGTRLAGIVHAATRESGGLRALEVNSSHHQAIAHPGNLLRVAAVSSRDGVIEALETADQERFVVAVQWHPERSYDASEASRALFSALIEAAQRWASNAWRATAGSTAG